MSSIDLSIIIPTFRRERELLEAVRSVLSLSGINFEILVVDDSPEGSAAEAIAAIDDPRVRYVKRDHPTGGRPALVRNEAVRAARGWVLYFLDDDDRAIAPNLERAYRQLANSSKGVLIGTPRPFGEHESVVAAEQAYFDQTLSVLSKPRSRWLIISRLLFSSTLLVCSSCLIKRDVFDAIGGFDADIPLCEDVEMYMRAIRRSGYTFQSAPILERRVGQPSLMNQADHLEKVKKSYQLFYQKYRERHGIAELLGLRLMGRLVP